MRRSIFTGLAILAVVLAGVVASVLLLPAERIGSWAAARASVALGRDVQVERFSVRLLPRPAVALSGVSIGGPGPGDSAFATADRVDLRPRLLPLLRRSIVIDEIAFERPVFRILIAADSSTNLPSIAGDDDAAASGDADIDIRRFSVNDGMVIYRDATTGTSARATGITQRLKLSGSVTSGAVDRIIATGELAVRDIDVAAPALLAWPINDLVMRIAHDVAIDRSTDRIELNELALTLQQITLDVTGAVTAARDSTARAIDLRARTGRVDVAHLIASLPKALLEDAAGDALTGAAGFAQLDLTAVGNVGAGSVPLVRGSLAIEDAALARGRHGTIATGLAGRLAFTLDSVSTDGITGQLLGEPLRIVFDMTDPAAPVGTVSVQAALALAQAQKLGLLPDSAEGSGRIAIDIRAAGSLQTPAEALLNGSVDLTGVTLSVATLERPVVVEQRRIAFEGRSATASGLKATIGASDVTLDFAASEWLPFALGDTLRPPVVTFDARSALFDADEILGAQTDTYTYGELFFARLADRPLDGKTAAEAAAEVGLGMPEVPHITMDGRIRATRFVRGAVPFQDVDITIAARAGEVDVRAASFRMMGGGVHMNGRLGLAAAGAGDGGAAFAQPLAVDYTINDVAAAQFIERYTAFRDHITGTLLLSGSMSMLLDEHLLPVRESVNGAGTAAVLEGEIVNWPLLRRLGERIGAAQFDTLAFSDWSGRYRIVGPRVVLEESMLQSDDMAVRAAGTFDLNGTLDLGATLYLAQAWAARVPGAPAAFLTSAAAGDDGRVPIGARFTGNTRDPSISLDMTEAGARIANAAREAAQEQARAAAARVTDQIADRLPPRDSLTAVADSAKQRVEAEVGSRLRRIIRPPGGS